MRPLISSGDPRKSVDISRKAELYETSSGMLTITGGKLTTWRRMAKQTVDRLVEREGREAPCHTAEIPLGMEARPEDLRAPEGVGEEAVAQLAFRYGHAAAQGAAPRPRGREAGAADRPRPPRPAGRGRRSPPATSRRARSPTCCCGAPGWGSWRRRSCATPARVRPVAEVLGAELGWSRRRVKQEAEAWPEAAAAEGIDPARTVAAG